MEVCCFLISKEFLRKTINADEANSTFKMTRMQRIVVKMELGRYRDSWFAFVKNNTTANAASENANSTVTILYIKNAFWCGKALLCRIVSLVFISYSSCSVNISCLPFIIIY